MSTHLISDATLAKIVRLVSLDNDAMADVSSGDCMRVIRYLMQDRPADALHWARRDGFSAGLLRLLEEANEEAARTHDERERAADPRGPLKHDTWNGPCECGAWHGLRDVTIALPRPWKEAAAEMLRHDATAALLPQRWTCPKCGSDLAVDRIFDIVAARGEREAYVVRCLCGEVRP